MRTRIGLVLAVLPIAALPLPANAVVRGTVGVGGFGQEVTDDFEPDTPPLTDVFQQDFTSGEPPVVTFSRRADGTVDGDYGFFSAYAAAELNGIPPTGPSFYGISSDVEIYAIDRVRVESDVLEDGTEVELAFDMVVQGNGRVSARMFVDRLEGPTKFRVLSLSYNHHSPDLYSEGTITALVGQRYQIEYSLGIALDVTPTGLSEENPTKFIVSEYDARFYVSPVSQPAVALAADSGHDYTAVPEPAGIPAGLAALCVLAWRARRGERGDEAPPRSVR